MNNQQVLNRHLESSEKARKKFRRWHWGLAIVSFLVLAVIIWVGFNAVHALGRISQVDNPFAGFFKPLPTLKGQTEGRTNILILGKGGSSHPGGQLTDTIIFGSYRWSDKKLALLSIPRDLYVPIARGGGKNKINYANAYGVQYFKDNPNAGPEIAAETVSAIFNQPVHYYLVVDFVGFKKIVDALGGVEVNVEKAIDDPYYPAEYFAGDRYVKTEDYQRFVLPAGEQKLDGETALKFARSRETTSDFDRAERQQQLIVAIKDKAVSVGVLVNPKKLVDLIQVLGDHVRTNLSVVEMERAISLIIRDLDTSQIVMRVLDNQEKGFLTNLSGGSGYYLAPKGGSFKLIQDYVANIFESEIATEETKSAQAPAVPESIQAPTGRVLGVITTETLVSVQNATGQPGTARAFSEILKEAGYTIYALTTAPKTLDETLIYIYTPDEDTQVTANLQKILPQAKVIRYPDEESPIDYRIILGQDYIL